MNNERLKAQVMIIQRGLKTIKTT